MSDILREIAGYQRESEALVTEWTALSAMARAKSWTKYTAMLDHGDAGYHRFAPILFNAWCDGLDGTQPFTPATILAAA